MRGSGVLAAAVAAASIGALVCAPGALAVPPPNDDFAAAQTLSGESGTATGTNVEATEETGEPDHDGLPGGESVWFTWTAPRDGVLFLDTCDADFDTVLAVYTGSSVDALTGIAVNHDDPFCGPQSGLDLTVVAGTQYRIAVDGDGAATGTIALFYAMAPANDDFVSASAITGASGQVSGTTFLASHEFGEPLHADKPGTGSVWYQWTAPNFGEARIDTCASSSDTLLAAYMGPSVASLTPIASNDDACGQGSAVTFPTIAGATYRIAVDGFGDYVDFTLSWSFRLLPPENLNPPAVSGQATVGSDLQGSIGRWRNATSFSYIWEACEPGTSNCALIPTPFPNPIRLRVPPSAAGQQIRFVVTASGLGGQTTLASAPTATVPYGPPVNTTPPSINAAVAAVGRTLTADEGEWDLGNAPRLNTTFLWQRCNYEGLNCRDLGTAGAQRTYRVTTADRGSTIQVVVTMVSAGGQTSEPSFPVEVVTPARCRVPRLVGKTLKTARRNLARAKCRLGKVRRTWSTRKVGVIVRQRPRAGTRLRVGGRVNVVLSKGRRR